MKNILFLLLAFPFCVYAQKKHQTVNERLFNENKTAIVLTLLLLPRLIILCWLVMKENCQSNFFWGVKPVTFLLPAILVMMGNRLIKEQDLSFALH